MAGKISKVCSSVRDKAMGKKIQRATCEGQLSIMYSTLLISSITYLSPMYYLLSIYQLICYSLFIYHLCTVSSIIFLSTIYLPVSINHASPSTFGLATYMLFRLSSINLSFIYHLPSFYCLLSYLFTFLSFISIFGLSTYSSFSL